MVDEHKYSASLVPAPLPGGVEAVQASVLPAGSAPAGAAPVKRRATVRFMFSHPAHVLALGFGSGLSPMAPGTVGTLWAWIFYLILRPLFSDVAFGIFLAASLAVGWWACTVTARNLNQPDPGSIVWDEILAFWLILWLVMPTNLLGQAVAFALFRYFDAAKPGPVGWADRRFKLRPGASIGWAQGFGVIFDDLVAALLSLIVFALGEKLVAVLIDSEQNPPAAPSPSFDDLAALARQLSALLVERGWMMASAESCTGGLIGAVCTSLAGSSVWYERGFVTYSNEAKSDMLGVPAPLIASFGAVSQEVAEAMALGALDRSKATASVAVTGIAGPGGGTADKPVGTVWIGVAFAPPSGAPVVASALQQFPGDRSAVRARTVARALQMLIAGASTRG